MSNHKSRIIWKNEIDILVAAKFGLKIQDVGLGQTSAERTMMFLSYLVSINDSVPTLYFPIAPYNRDESDDFLTSMITTMWENISSSLKPDSESMIGQYFECQVPHIIYRNVDYQVLISCGKLHFVAQVQTKLPNISGINDVLLVMQVTTQTSNVAHKFQKSIVGMTLRFFL